MRIENGTVHISIAEILEALTDDEKVSLVDSLACEDVVIRGVADQLLGGCTELGSHGYRSGVGSATRPLNALDVARRRIAEGSSEIVKQEIEALKSAILMERDLGRKGWEAYHELLRERNRG